MISNARFHVVLTIASACATSAVADTSVPFEGQWSCAQRIENTVMEGRWKETYDRDGRMVVRGRPIRGMSVKRTSEAVYDLRYPHGQQGQIIIETAGRMIRTTEDHTYVCERADSP